jgi:hypothetical protein
MTTATHPYGTTRRGVVKLANWRPAGLDPRASAGQLIFDDQNEMHVCVGDCGDVTAKEGDSGTLTFTKGGPTGGYWKFKKDCIEYVVEWLLRDGKVSRSATLYPTVEAAQADIDLAFRNRQNWSGSWRIIEAVSGKMVRTNEELKT